MSRWWAIYMLQWSLWYHSAQSETLLPTFRASDTALSCISHHHHHRSWRVPQGVCSAICCQQSIWHDWSWALLTALISVRTCETWGRHLMTFGLFQSFGVDAVKIMASSLWQLYSKMNVQWCVVKPCERSLLSGLYPRSRYGMRGEALWKVIAQWFISSK